MESFSFEATGTHWEISLPKNKIDEKLVNEIKKYIDTFESTYSRFRKDSLVNNLSSQVGTFELPKEAKELFDIYYELYKLTNGSFTPFIGKTLEEAGYDKTYSFKQKELSKSVSWEDILSYEHQNIVVKNPIQLDFGAAGKGYIIDLVGKLLEDKCIYTYCIDAGHDILYKTDQQDEKPLRIGLEHPNDITKVIGVTNILNNSICGSSGNRRNWGKYHHIIDANSLESPKDIISTWVITAKTIEADALSTSLFFVKPEILLSKYDFEYLILYNDSTINKSQNFPGEMFT